MNYSSLFSDCWALGSSYLPLCGLPTWAAAFLPGFGGEIIPVGHRRFRVLQKLGEGGYAVVLLVVEVPSEHRPHPDPEPRALKKVLVQSGDHFDAVQQEMLIHSTVQHHPNILALLDYCCSEGDKPQLQPPPPPPSSSGSHGPWGLSPMRHPPPPPPISHSTPASPQQPVTDGVASRAVGSGAAATAAAAAAATAAAAAAGGPPSAASAPGTAPGVGPRWSIDVGATRPGVPSRGPTRFGPASGARGGLGALALGVSSGGAAGPGGGADGGGGGSWDRVACFVFPVFRDGTLAMELDRLRGRGEMLPTREVLAVFGQIAKAAAHVHAHGYAHRDIKPLNVLISVDPAHRPAPPSGPASPARSTQHPRQSPHSPPHQPRSPGQLLSWWHPGPSPLRHPSSSSAGGGGAGDVEAGAALMDAGGAAGGATQGPRYRCVLMDFGSARLRGVELATRAQALQLQEDAEAHCSAPYRAPELFDAPSPSSLDFAACDVWALGATLFQIMYGEPPFDRAMNGAGGSLALAVLNCAIGWPRPGSPAYPPELHQLVQAAMAPEPRDRPTAERLALMAEELAQRGLPDPRPAPA